MVTKVNILNTMLLELMHLLSSQEDFCFYINWDENQSDGITSRYVSLPAETRSPSLKKSADSLSEPDVFPSLSTVLRLEVCQLFTQVDLKIISY